MINTVAAKAVNLRNRLSIAKLRKLWYFLLAGLTCLITVVGYYPPGVTQTGGSFVCDRTLYISQVRAGAGTPTDLNRVLTNPFGLELIGTADQEYNAIGFNVIDGFIYAMAPQSVGANPPVVYRIDNNGTANSLGSATGFPVIPAGSTSNAFAADIDRNGSYFVYVTNVAAGQPNLFQINLATTPPSVVNSFTLNNTNFTDISFNPVDDQLYAFDNTQLQVARIDLASSTVTYFGGIQDNINPPVGGAFFNPFGNFFIYDNAGNVLEAPNVANADQVVFQQQGFAEQASRFDGASCAFRQDLEKTVEPTTVPANGIVTYRYRFANGSSSDLVNITFRDVMPDARTFVAGTLTNPFGGTPNAFGGTQTLEITGLTLPSRTIAEISVQVQVPRTIPSGTIFNQATISPFPDSSNNPNFPSDFPFNPDFPNSGQIPDATPLIVPPTPIIGLAKTVGSVVNLGNGNYQVTYNLVVANQGNVALSGVQVTENLTTTFGTVPFTVNSVSSPSGNLAPNNNFNGVSDTNLLAGTDTLAVGESKAIALVVTITPGSNLGPYDNQAEAIGQSPNGQTVRDLSNDGTNTDPDNDGDPTNNNVPTRLSLVENPVLGVAKTVVSLVDAGGGNFTATYNILAQNLGEVPLNNLQLTENLSTTFGSTPFTVNRVSSPSGNLTPNTNFNGVSDINLLSGTDTLAVGETKTIELVVTLTPGSNLGPYDNQVEGIAQSPSGQPVRDLSNDGINPDPDNDSDPTNNNVPTRLSLVENPILGVAKTVVSLVDAGGGNFTATYNILAQNLGAVPLNNLQLTENLSTTFGTTPFTVNRVSSPTGNLTPNNNFNGVSDINLLSGTDTLAVGETKTIELVVTLTPGSNRRTYENQVEGIAQSRSGQSVRDLSNDGINPDPDSDRNPTNNNIPTLLELITDPRLRLVKRITNVTRDGVPVSGINFLSIVNDPNDPNVSAAGWSQLPGGGLVGVFRLGSETLLRSGDEVEYTVYFLSDGGQPTTNVNICDPIPVGTTFLPDSFGAGSGILLNQSGTETRQTNASDPDKGTFFSPLNPVTAPCPDSNNPNGSVVLQLGDIPNTAPNNVGFVRFRVRIE